MLYNVLRKKKCIRASSILMIMIILAGSILGAALAAPVSVFALSAGGIKATIASLIISLMMQTGAAPTNTQWVNSLNSAYGYTIESAISEGLLTQTAEGLVDSGLSSAIEAAPEYTSLGISDIFTTTLADEGVAAASAGTNLANTAIHVGTAGTIGAFAGAVAVGVGAGVLINHIRKTLGTYIKYGFPMSENTRETIINNIPSGFSKCYYVVRKNGNTYYSNFYFVNDPSICVSYPTGNYGFSSIVANKVYNERVPYNRKNYVNKTLQNDSNGPNLAVGPGIADNISNQLMERKVDYEASSQEEAQEIISEYQAGTVEIPKTVSPDIIGPEGNQAYDSDSDTFPGLVNQIPEGSDMEPVDMEDYQNFVDDANQNTEDGNTDEPIQGALFDDLIRPLIVATPTIPDTPIIPDQPVDVPTVPDRPVNPEQPNIPDKPGLTDAEIQEALKGATTIDLRSIFPFCIPFDLYTILLIFDTGENRRAPHINFTFPGTNWNIDIDMAVFDDVAGILRVLELILFIIGLAVATRKLIGAGG